MAKTNAQNQKAYRDRRIKVRRQQIELILEVLEGIADGSNGITCTTTTDLWGIHFDWGGEQAAYNAPGRAGQRLGFHPANHLR